MKNLVTEKVISLRLFKAVKLTTDLKLQTITIGTTLHVFDELMRPEIERIARKALKKGDKIRWQDGREQWKQWDIQINPGQEGSKVYNWDTTGNRVAADICIVTKKGKIITKTKIGKGWVKP